MTNGGGEQPENENTSQTSGRGRSKSGESVVAWTIFFWAALSGGSIALSVAASSVGREATEKGATMWMADAGGSLKDSFLGFYGVLGTIVVAMSPTAPSLTGRVGRAPSKSCSGGMCSGSSPW